MRPRFGMSRVVPQSPARQDVCRPVNAQRNPAESDQQRHDRGDSHDVGTFDVSLARTRGQGAQSEEHDGRERRVTTREAQAWNHDRSVGGCRTKPIESQLEDLDHGATSESGCRNQDRDGPFLDESEVARRDRREQHEDDRAAQAAQIPHRVRHPGVVGPQRLEGAQESHVETACLAFEHLAAQIREGEQQQQDSSACPHGSKHPAQPLGAAPVAGQDGGILFERHCSNRWTRHLHRQLANWHHRARVGGTCLCCRARNFGPARPEFVSAQTTARHCSHSDDKHTVCSRSVSLAERPAQSVRKSLGSTTITLMPSGFDAAEAGRRLHDERAGCGGSHRFSFVAGWRSAKFVTCRPGSRGAAARARWRDDR